MRREDFFQGLFAALRIRDIDFIDVRGDQHQRRFSRVAEWLDEHPDAADRLGVCFFPSPFNGRYPDFDAELLRKQVGLLSAKNPFYPGIHLHFTPERARAILEKFPLQDQSLFTTLAEEFVEAENPVAA